MPSDVQQISGRKRTRNTKLGTQKGRGRNEENDNFPVDILQETPPPWVIELAQALARYRARMAYRNES